MDKRSCRHIGEFISPIDVRNGNGGVSRLVGLTIAKQFIPSVANTNGTDLTSYKVIRKNQFACSLMQVSRDGKMPVAMYPFDEPAIISPAYPMFEVSKPDEILPEYLMMWFQRKEFDREACFYAVGGVRGSLEWEDFCNMRLPVPDIATQRRIVAEYQAVENRIVTNENLIAKLEATARTIYKKMFVDDIDPEHLPEGWRMGKMIDLFELQRGFDLPGQDRVSGNVPVYASTGIASYHIESKVKAPGVITGRSGSIGDVFYSDVDFWPLNTTLWVKDFKQSTPMFVYYKLKNTDIEALVGGSSAVPTLNRNDINILSTPIPSCVIMRVFEDKCSLIERKKEIVVKENETLSRLLSLLLTKMIQ